MAPPTIAVGLTDVALARSFVTASVARSVNGSWSSVTRTSARLPSFE